MLPKLANTYREMLYDRRNPSLIDTHWTNVRGNTIQRQGAVQVQHCEYRLRKSKEAGTNVGIKEGRVENPRMTTGYVENFCCLVEDDSRRDVIRLM